MDHYLIIENDRAVHVVRSTEDMERRAQYGWRVVFDCASDDWRTVLRKAHAYARERRKTCNLPPGLSDEELADRLNQAYTLLLGEETMGLLGRLYAQEPDTAVKLMQDLIREAAGSKTTTPKAEEQLSPATKKQPKRKKRE